MKGPSGLGSGGLFSGGTNMKLFMLLLVVVGIGLMIYGVIAKQRRK
jgi:hypothetical protein